MHLLAASLPKGKVIKSSFLIIYRKCKRNASYRRTPPLCFLQRNIGEVARSAGGVEKNMLYIHITTHRPNRLSHIIYKDNVTHQNPSGCTTSPISVTTEQGRKIFVSPCRRLAERESD